MAPKKTKKTTKGLKKGKKLEKTRPLKDFSFVKSTDKPSPTFGT